MKISSASKVREFYERSADSYNEMMDAEINHKTYSDTLSRLAERISELGGPVIDSSCGSGHMLSRYQELYDPERSLLGIDLSPRMVAIASARLGSKAKIATGDMRALKGVKSGSAAAILSFFAIHHIAPEEILAAFREWRRVLRVGGQLVLATWEGAGSIDYGESCDIVAFRYGKMEVAGWVHEAGFGMDHLVVKPVEDMPMNAIYLEASKPK